MPEPEVVERNAVIETEKGTIKLVLYEKDAPITTANFIELAERGFYDGLTFHRVEPNFVIQGGDPNGNGSGGPGYEFEDEAVGNPHKHVRGTLSMANAGPNTNGSQFFIVTRAEASNLDGSYSAFGQVLE